MIVVCCQCNSIRGEKAPFDNKEHTHGYCLPCFQKNMIQMNIKPAIIYKKIIELKEDIRDKVIKGEYIEYSR